MKTRAARLNWAIENHGPGRRTQREFQRAARPHVGRVRSSGHIVGQYLSGDKEVPDAYLAGAVKVLGPVRLQWLQDGSGARVDGGKVVDDAPEPPAATAAPGPATEPKAHPPEDSPFADIFDTVQAAGPNPGADALEALDSKYPRNGLSERNWKILHDRVTGKDEEAVAADAGLSTARIRAIGVEYADLVRAAAGIPETG
jgi:hypothetical protein